MGSPSPQSRLPPAGPCAPPTLLEPSGYRPPGREPRPTAGAPLSQRPLGQPGQLDSWASVTEGVEGRPERRRARPGALPAGLSRSLRAEASGAPSVPARPGRVQRLQGQLYRDGRKGGRGGHGSLVNKRGAQDEAGREGVCSRGQRRLISISQQIPWLCLPLPCPELWLTPSKVQNLGSEAPSA